MRTIIQFSGLCNMPVFDDSDDPPTRIQEKICNGGTHPHDGKGCDRHEAPDGVRTDGPWWMEPIGLARRTRVRLEGASLPEFPLDKRDTKY